MRDKHIILASTGAAVVAVGVAAVFIADGTTRRSASTVNELRQERSKLPATRPFPEAETVLRAVGKDPDEVAPGEKADLQRSIERLADTLERNKRENSGALDSARAYAKREYEHNETIMSEEEARRQYQRDLANIDQEERDKGIHRSPNGRQK